MDGAKAVRFGAEERFQADQSGPDRSILDGRVRKDCGACASFHGPRRIPVSDRGTFGGLSQSVSQFGFAGSATSL
jgi:hypothetical protein